MKLYDFGNAKLKVIHLFKGKIQKIISCGLLLILAILLTFPGCSGATFPVEVNVSFSEPPILGKPVQFSATFNLVKDHYREVEENVTASIILSEGFELVDGNAEWKGDFIRGQTYYMNVTIKSVKIGTWKIGAQALYSPGESALTGGAEVLYVTVSEYSATISDRPPDGVPTPRRTSPPASESMAPDHDIIPEDNIATILIPSSPPSLSSISNISAASLPIQAGLAVSEPPSLGEPVKITGISLTEGYANESVKNITAYIILSEGFELVSGNAEWKGDFVRNQNDKNGHVENRSLC